MVWGVYPQLGSLEQIRADLEALSALDLTPLDVPEPELAYLFKHIITQEVHVMEPASLHLRRHFLFCGLYCAGVI